MSYVLKVKDTVENKEKDVKSFKEVLSFLVIQTMNLLIQSHLTADELIKLQWLEHNVGEIILLNRFVVTSQIGA